MSRWNHYYNNNNEYFENDRINNRQKDCDDDNRAYECSCLNDPREDEYSCECECSKCPPGPCGPACPRGPQGPAGGVLNYADFYALMPPDNTATVAPGTDASFPQDGPNSGGDISRTGPDSFNLTQIGTYHILFEVSVTEAG